MVEPYREVTAGYNPTLTGCRGFRAQARVGCRSQRHGRQVCGATAGSSPHAGGDRRSRSRCLRRPTPTGSDEEGSDLAGRPTAQSSAHASVYGGPAVTRNVSVAGSIMPTKDVVGVSPELPATMCVGPAGEGFGVLWRGELPGLKTSWSASLAVGGKVIFHAAMSVLYGEFPMKYAGEHENDSSARDHASWTRWSRRCSSAC